MPNYNYRTTDYMRRSQCQRPLPTPTPRADREFAEHTACEEGSPVCKSMHDLLKGMPVAMAYVPWQEFQNLYAAEKALCRGTIFEELDKPFSGKGGCCR